MVRSLFLFILPLILSLIGSRSQAQGSFTVTPATGLPTERLTLVISSDDVQFHEAASVCPSQLQVSASNVVFRQGTATVFTPESITTENGQLTAVVLVPEGTIEGPVEVTLGEGEECPISQYGAFNVVERRISISSVTPSPGQTVDVTITAHNFSLDETLPSECPGLVNISASDVVFTSANGSPSFSPDAITVQENVITATVTVPSSAPSGYYDVRVGSVADCPVYAFYSFSVATGLNVSPATAYPGGNLDVTITGNVITFDAAGPSECPGKLHVTASNVSFVQATATAYTFYPQSVTVSGSEIIANITVPEDAGPGVYNITVGEGEACPAVAYYSFTVIEPAIHVYPSMVKAGETVNVTIDANYLDFESNLSSACPSRLHVNAGNVVLRNGSGLSFNPVSLNTQDGNIIASFTIPSDAPSGPYDVSVGEGEDCHEFIHNGVYIANPSIHVNPQTGIRGGVLEVTVTGSHIGFTQASPTMCPDVLNITASDVEFRQGASVLTPSSITLSHISSSLTAILEIPQDTPEGLYDVVVGTGSECPVTKVGGFYVREENTQAISLSPSSAVKGQTLDVTLTGINLGFSETSPTECPALLNVTASNVFFRQGSTTIMPGQITVSGNTIVATVTVPNDAPGGYYEVVVGEGEGCSVIKSAGFRIAESDGNILSFTPIPAAPGEQFSIAISDPNVAFSETSATVCPDLLNISAANVLFRNAAGQEIIPSRIWVSEDEIVADVDIPFNAAPGHYDLVIGDGEACPLVQENRLYVESSPFFSVHPEAAQAGQSVQFTLTGANANFDNSLPSICGSVQASNVILKYGDYSFAAAEITYLSFSGAVVTVNIPGDAPEASYQVIVRNGDVCQLSSNNTVFVEELSVASISLSPEILHTSDVTEVTITGTNVSFTETGSSNCPDLVKITATNVVLIQDDMVFTDVVELISISDQTIVASFNIPPTFQNGIYNVVVGAGEDCPVSAEVQVATLTGNFAAAETSGYSVYPNPTDGTLLGLDLLQNEEVVISIHDEYGRLILTQQASGPAKLNLAESLQKDLAQGLYFITITGESGTKASKFVVR